MACFLPSAPALAHAALIAAQPADGAMLQTAPKTFDLTFSEAVSPLVLTLIAPDGSATPLDGAQLRDGTLVVPAPSGIGEGTFALTWRVISEDGHPVAGTLVFSIGTASAGGAPGADAVVDGKVRSLVWLSKLLLYLGLFIGAGGVVYGAVVQRLQGRSILIVRAALVLGLLAAPLALGAQGLDALGAAISSLGQPVVWTTALATSFGKTVAIAALVFVTGLLATTVRSTILRNGLAAFVLLGIGDALSASGHASSAAPQWLMRPAVFVHSMSIAFWVGSLTPLAQALRQKDPQGMAALARFSAIVPWAISALVVSGMALAFVQLGSIEALWQTAYGQVLLVKLALLAGLFILAAVNRWHLTGKVNAADYAARDSLARVIAVEIVLVVLILGTVSLWRFTPPPRVIAAAAAEPVTAHMMSNRVMVDLSVTPGHKGAVTATAVLLTIDYGPIDAKEVTFVFSNPEAGIEPIRRPATKPGDGTWRADATLPVSGRWKVRLDVLIDDFTLDRVEGEVLLRP